VPLDVVHDENSTSVQIDFPKRSDHKVAGGYLVAETRSAELPTGVCADLASVTRKTSVVGRNSKADAEQPWPNGPG